MVHHKPGEDVKPSKFVHVLVTHPFAFACVTLIIAIILAIIGPAMVISNGDELFATTGAYDISHVTAEHQDALTLARDDTHADIDEDKDANVTVAQQSKRGDVVFLLFEATQSSNVYTEPLIKKMKEVQDKILQDPDFSKYCLRANTSTTACAQPLSPINIFYGEVAPTLNSTELAIFDNANFDAVVTKCQQLFPVHGPTSNFVNAVAATFPAATQGYAVQAASLYVRMYTISKGFTGNGPLQNVEQTLQLVQKLQSMPALAGSTNFFFDKSFANTAQSKYARAIITFGKPLAGFKNADDRAADQAKLLSDWFNDKFREYLTDVADSTEGMDVLYFATPLVGAEFLLILLVDGLLAFGSFAFVLFYLWFQTGSLWVAVVGIIEIVLSIPIAYTVYHSILQFSYLAGINGMTFYIVFAIGADDIFVFMDAFKQSAYQDAKVLKNIETRMTWTYRRAAGAMLITSFTTMCAFVATAISPLVEVASFGIFAAMVILIDYLLVITFMPACVVIWHNYMATKPNFCCACCQKSGCSKLCRKQDKTQTELALAECQAAAAEGKPREVKLRLFERIFNGPISNLVTSPKTRFPIMVLFLVWIIPVIIFATQAEPATQPDQFLPSSHPFQRIFDILNHEFPASSEDPNTAVYIVFGLSGVNRDGVVLLVNPTDLGAVTYTSDFEVTPAAQTWLLGVCDQLQALPFAARDKDDPLLAETGCVMRDFKSYCNSTNTAFPVPTASFDATFTAFANSPAVPEPGQRLPPGSTYASTHNELWFGIKDGKVKYIALESAAKLRDRGFQSSSQIRSEYDNFEAFMGTLNAAVPAGLGQGFQTTATTSGVVSKWVWMHTQGLYVQSAVSGSVFGTCLAFVVLLAATRNLLVAFAATFTIAGILSSVLAFMTMLGWKLGVIESISLTILAGFSVDYVVHLAHAYMESGHYKRADRVRDAFTTMGVSVLSGMLTSVGASSMLFLTTLVFFSKFGGFLCSTVVFSWLWANFFFMGVLATVGPRGDEKYFGLVCSSKARTDVDDMGTEMTTSNVVSNA